MVPSSAVLAVGGPGMDGSLLTRITGLTRGMRGLNGPVARWTDAGLAAFKGLSLISITAWTAWRSSVQEHAPAGTAPGAVGVAASWILCHLLMSWIGPHCLSGPCVELGSAR